MKHFIFATKLVDVAFFFDTAYIALLCIISINLIYS
jgi:hypothetical protein